MLAILWDLHTLFDRASTWHNKTEDKKVSRYVKTPVFAMLLLAMSLPQAFGAQKFEVSPHIGFRNSGQVELNEDNTLGVASLDFDRATAFGANLAYHINNVVAFEFLWSRQQHSMVTGLMDDGTPVAQTTDANLTQYHVLARPRSLPRAR